MCQAEDLTRVDRLHQRNLTRARLSSHIVYASHAFLSCLINVDGLFTARKTINITYIYS